jgi:queuine/archaeosine tRNA-ribosyltransferase
MGTKRKAEELDERPTTTKRHKPSQFLFELFTASDRGLDLNKEIDAILEKCTTKEKQTHKVWLKTLREARDSHKDNTTKQYVIMFSLMQMKSYRDERKVTPEDLQKFEDLSRANITGRAIDPHTEVTNKTPSEAMVRTKDTLMFHTRNYYLHA